MFTFPVFCDLYLALKLCTYLSLISYICYIVFYLRYCFAVDVKLRITLGGFLSISFLEKNETQKLAQRITLPIWCHNLFTIPYILDIHNQRMPLTWKPEMFKESSGRINTPSPFAKFNFEVIKLKES